MSRTVYKLYFTKADENALPFWAVLYTSPFEQDIKGAVCQPVEFSGWQKVNSYLLPSTRLITWASTPGNLHTSELRSEPGQGGGGRTRGMASLVNSRS